MHNMDADLTYREKAWRQLQKNAVSNIEHLWKQRPTNQQRPTNSSAPQTSRCKATYHPSRKLLWLDEADMRDASGEVKTNS